MNHNKDIKNALVSIIMNCRDGEKYLKDAIDSVISQTYENWEIIFWDNKSTDDSKNIFNMYQDDRLRYYQSSADLSLGAARNCALKKANGEFIAFLDCDDLWLPRKLEMQLPRFANKSVGLVICDTIFFNEKKDIRQLYKRKKPPEGMVFNALLGDYFVSLETAIIRAETLNGMNHWFDDRFEVIEEYDFFTRLGYDWEIAYVDKVLAKWRVHGASLTWQRPDLFPYETQIFLEKLTKIVPNFSTDFAREIASVEGKVALQKAILMWRKGEPREARLILNGVNDKSISMKLIYGWTLFFPYKTFDVANKIRLGLRL